MTTPPGVWIDYVEVERSGRSQGLTPEMKSIFFSKPQEWEKNRYAREVIRRFANKAFRTTEPSTEYLNKLVGLFEANMAKGSDLKEALLQPLSLVLTSPSFVYMIESTGNKRLTDAELAVRLSYFLWSSPPDEELMNKAREGKLSDPTELKRQTSRLLNDSRANRFVRDFSYQWLGMERLGIFAFDSRLYPGFDTAVLKNSSKEIFETVGYVLKNKLPLKTLLSSDFIMANDIMASYYGISGVEGHKFRKVSLPAESPRGGLLSTAAVLAMGSDGTKSSPEERGVWVLKHLLHDPPPPAPPNVAQLDRLESGFRTARELVKAHQEEPQCYQCHQKIDPIGYGMEHFNAAGLWRDMEEVHDGKKSKLLPIDPSGTLADGTTFKDYFELRSALVDKVDSFARGSVESIIAYGLGRPYGFTDYDLAEHILKETKPSGYKLDQMIHSLIETKTFQSK